MVSGCVVPLQYRAAKFPPRGAISVTVGAEVPINPRDTPLSAELTVHEGMEVNTVEKAVAPVAPVAPVGPTEPPPPPPGGCVTTWANSVIAARMAARNGRIVQFQEKETLWEFASASNQIWERGHICALPPGLHAYEAPG